MKFDFGLVALVLVIAKTALDYIAPRTKTKRDDQARDLVGKAQDALPIVKPLVEGALGSKSEKAGSPVVGFGTARDHRKA